MTEPPPEGDGPPTDPCAGMSTSETTRAPDRDPEGLMPRYIFFVGLAWLIALIALFVVFINTDSLRAALPHFYGRNPGIPVEVPWFGAVGGSLVSFSGIVSYNRCWKSSYNLWHMIRPLLGAVSGGISCLLLVVILRAATSSTNLSTDPITFDVVAFVFGYAEGAFRQLIKNVTDILLKPGVESNGKPLRAGEVGTSSPAGPPALKDSAETNPDRPR